MHAICLQHIQRELRATDERENDNPRLLKDIEGLLLEMRKAKLDAIEEGKDSIPGCLIEIYRTWFRAKIGKGLEPQPERGSQPGPGRIPQGKTRSLLLRLKEHMDSVFCYVRRNGAASFARTG